MRTSLAAILVLLLFSGPIRAQDTITLLVRSRGMAPGDLAFVVRGTADLLNKNKGILADVPARPLDGDTLSKSRDKAAALLEEARELYKKFDETGALGKLAESRAALLAGCGGADAGLLRSQVLLEGLIHFTAGRRDPAQLAFSQLAALDPAFEPDTANVAPKVVAAFREAKEEVLGKKPGLLELAGRPQGAKVRLDGGEPGTLPAVFDRVPPGNHCLEVTDPAHGAWVARVTMPAGGTVRMRAILFPACASGLLEGEPGLPRDADPGELARGFSTGYLALGDAEESRVTIRLISARTGKVSEPVACETTPELENMLPCLHDGLVSAHKVLSTPPALVDLGPPPPPPVVVEPAGTAWYKSWWFWSIVGGVALAGSALTIGIVLSEGGNNPDYWVTVTRP
ncbi:PEGA domain-containing protein [Myxococcota bacterium]